jgi:hypothetical protein
MCNALYAILTSLLVFNQNVDIQTTEIVNDGKIGFLAGFSLFVAGLVVLKFMFALFYHIKWNLRMWCCTRYKKSRIDVAMTFKQLKSKKNGLSSDEEGLDVDETGDSYDRSYNL